MRSIKQDYNLLDLISLIENKQQLKWIHNWNLAISFAIIFMFWFVSSLVKNALKSLKDKPMA